MTDKEFKKLNRAQLIEIIYQYQLQVDALTGKIQELETALEDKRIRIGNVGNIAEAALEINECFRSAQSAAEQYLNEIEMMRKQTEEECERMLAAARAEVETIRSKSAKKAVEEAFLIETILQEYERKYFDNR